MRFLFSCVGAPGHFHPLVPLARALQHAGHTVAFATHASLRGAVESLGFDFFAAGGNMSSDPQYRELKERLRAMPLDLASERFAYPRIFCGIGARLRAPDLVAIARNWQPDLLVREAAEYGAVVAAEHLALPHAAVSFAAALKGLLLFEREAAAQLDRVRELWGLPPDPDLDSLYRYLLLAFSPPAIALHDVGTPEIPRPVPATAHLCRPEFFDRSAGESLPAWVETLPARPTVYVTLGTEVNKDPDLYPGVLQTIIAGLRDEPLNLIVTLGRDKSPQDFGPQPANVHVERYIPQSLLLRHCDLMVMHGGSNSLLAALDAGLPLVVVPLLADQFFNAHVTRSLGLGPVIPRAKLSPAAVRAAVADVLANPTYRDNVARLRADMQSLPGMQQAVRLVEHVASGQGPFISS